MNSKKEKSAKKEEDTVVDESKEGIKKNISNNESEEGDCDRIIGITKANGQLEFLMKLKDEKTPQLISSKIAGTKWPQLVIDFYEQRMRWEK